jgi:hypothetical protein
LSQHRKDIKGYESRKSQLEMKGCTFKPNIDKKSEAIAQNNRLTSNKSYEVLFKKHNNKMEKVKKLIQEKEQKEASECTFAPQL